MRLTAGLGEPLEANGAEKDVYDPTGLGGYSYLLLVPCRWCAGARSAPPQRRQPRPRRVGRAPRQFRSGLAAAAGLLTPIPGPD